MALDLTPLARPSAPDLSAGLRLPRRREAGLTGTLLVLTVAVVTISSALPLRAGAAALVPVVVAAGLFLRGTPMYLVFGVVAGGLVVMVFSPRVDSAPLLSAAVAAVLALMVVGVERQRLRRSVVGPAGAVVLTELRERLQDHARMPELPGGWHADSSVRTARDDAFGGDFLVVQREGSDLDLLLVDVAGQGMPTGSRAVMLANAFAGVLLGRPAPEEVMPAANRFVSRQRCADLLATAVHVRLDLGSGRYRMSNAGHPAAMHYCAASGVWQPVERGRGVMLGVVEPELASYGSAGGRLARGDALLLFSDGVVEDHTCGGLEQGMRQMLAAADREIRRPSSGGAGRICAKAVGGAGDDRSVVLIRRA